MSQNIVEYLREAAVRSLFEMDTFNNAWNTWRGDLNQHLGGNITPQTVVDLGDRLSEVFQRTSVSGRSQANVSGAGNAWEGLVCWYLNLCLIGTRTVVVKQKRELVPDPIRQALTVRYGNFPSNTESDLIAITFPDKQVYVQDKSQIAVMDSSNNLIKTIKPKSQKFNYRPIVDALTLRDFSDFEVGIIQCKTNWNDNAQIPMLWDMIYASNGFAGNIVVGSGLQTIQGLSSFSYSFVTVPTVRRDNFKSTSTAVKRVQSLSGGNYWGHESRPNVASSLKEIFNRNFRASSAVMPATLGRELSHLQSTYSYFRL